MASAMDVLGTWATGNQDREALLGQQKGLVLRWLNEGQLRFADKSQVLRGIWKPTLLSDGTATLPEDFLRAVKNRVKWDSTTLLAEVDYADMQSVSLSDTRYYAIWGDKFYVLAASAGTPEIPYYKKPSEIVFASIAVDDLEIPAEYHHELIAYLDAMYQRMKGDLTGYTALMAQFDLAATQCGAKYGARRSAIPMMKGGWF